jgi:hypothetical protein
MLLYEVLKLLHHRVSNVNYKFICILGLISIGHEVEIRSMGRLTATPPSRVDISIEFYQLLNI